MSCYRLPGPRLVTVAGVAQTFVRGALGVLIVVLALDVLGTGDAGVALLTAAFGLGGLLGSGLAAGVTVGQRLGPLFAVALIAWGVPIALIAPLPTTLVAIVMLTVVGISNAFVDVTAYGLLQGCIPDRQRTSAMGAFRAVVSLGVAAGSVAAWALLSIFDTPQVLLIIGLVLPVLVLALWPRWHPLDDRLIVSRELVDALRRCPIFEPLTLAQLEQLAGGTVRARYEVGAVVIAEGEVGDAFYLITEGHASVTSAGQPLNTMGPGDSFGEVALLRRVPRTATVVATSPLDVYRIDSSTFVSAITGNPSESRRCRSGRDAHRAGSAAADPPPDRARRRWPHRPPGGGGPGSAVLADHSDVRPWARRVAVDVPVVGVALVCDVVRDGRRTAPPRRAHLCRPRPSEAPPLRGRVPDPGSSKSHVKPGSTVTLLGSARRRQVVVCARSRESPPPTTSRSC